MTMIGTLVWGGRKTGAEITGRTDDRAGRQVKDRIVETGGRCSLVADSRRIGCSRQTAPPVPESIQRKSCGYTDNASCGIQGSGVFLDYSDESFPSLI